ncbi:MAG: protoporphyrinogen oxidase, partial [Gemmataceae bacterium]|nr:protoporphyrinogen oxidase [Gemmataceae bacterium]
MPHIVIVGAGLTGLATAFWLRRRAPYVRVTLLEARERAGGNVGTEQIHGFRIERGPNGFLARSPALPRLIEALGLSERLLPASSGSRRHRFLYLHGQLHRVPSHPVGLLLSTLLSGEGKKELLVGLCRQIRFSPANRDQDESVYDFVARRFGREVADVFADALVTGIQGGDPKLLSMAACFPRLVDWERRYGSVIRGMIQYVRQQRRQAQQAPGSLSRSQLYSFREGLQVLVDTLVQAVGASLNLAAPVTALRYQPATAVWQVYSP